MGAESTQSMEPTGITATVGECMGGPDGAHLVGLMVQILSLPPMYGV
jgi:hypothetical protein